MTEPVGDPVLEDASGRWSEGRLAAEAGALARRLRAARPDGGRLRVAHRFGLEPSAVVALRAIARAGAIVAPVHPGWDADQEAAFLRAVDPDVLVAGASWAPDAPGWRRASPEPRAGPGGCVVWHGADRAGAATGVGRAVPPAIPAGTDVLLSTSGTGGSPRIVCHSWATLAANARASARRNGFGPGDAWLATLAWAHVGGLAVPVRAVACGGRVVFGPPGFDPEVVAEALARLRVTHVSLVPAMLHALLETGTRPPPALRCALLGGSATPPDLVRRAAAQGWPVTLTYGLTEMGSQVATAGPGESVGDPDGWVGTPLDGIDVRLGHGGEIRVRGPSRMLGIAGEPPPAEWLDTGDLGEVGPDGRLRVTGRLADRIVSGGANVDPVGVEAVLARHPGVREVCVVGTPDPVWGEVVTAVVVPGEGPVDGAPPLEAWARERLRGARRPRRWCFVEALPRTATGKVDRARIRAEAAARARDARAAGGGGDGSEPDEGT